MSEECIASEGDLEEIYTTKIPISVKILAEPAKQTDADNLRPDGGKKIKRGLTYPVLVELEFAADQQQQVTIDYGFEGTQPATDSVLDDERRTSITFEIGEKYKAFSITIKPTAPTRVKLIIRASVGIFGKNSDGVEIKS